VAVANFSVLVRIVFLEGLKKMKKDVRIDGF
jgi:hypothetical protein